MNWGEVILYFMLVIFGLFVAIPAVLYWWSFFIGAGFSRGHWWEKLNIFKSKNKKQEDE